MSLLAVAAVTAAAATPLPAWTFDRGLEGWAPNAHIAQVATNGGVVRGETVDVDPMFILRGIDFPARPWQYVVLRMKSDTAGACELYWSAETTGRYGGISPDKKTRFTVAAGPEFQEIVLFPFWQGEHRIRQLRLDLFAGMKFEIDSISVREWGGGAAPLTAADRFSPGPDGAAWRIYPAAEELFAPPLDLDVRERGWVTVTLEAARPGTAALLWSPAGGRGLEEMSFALRPGAGPKGYNLQLDGAPGWSRIVALGLRLPPDAGVRIGDVALAADPGGPPELVVDRLGFEDALPRAGRPCRVLALVRNLGGSASAAGRAALSLPADVTAAPPGAETALPALDHNDHAELRWTVAAAAPGARKVALSLDGRPAAEAVLDFLPVPAVPAPDRAAGVPAPRPVATDVEVCAYYFPGWESDTKWDCIRRVAPIRKPALGYYDEGNPECVDWQIKWARENGISCFLVDWYWVRGAQHLNHWFDAYRKARHRDQLKVAIMWANHNPKGTHSAEDWERVTRHWIEHYFPLPAYQRIGGRPAVYLWAPGNLREDVGGSAAVRALMDRSQALAREAGYGGIAFVAMNGGASGPEMKRLADEGYGGSTTYHEWGSRSSAKRFPYEQVVADGPSAWERRRVSAAEAGLAYYPVVDTGWDARPWHGDKSFVIEGRTPALFRRNLENAREFARAHGIGSVVLGPLNEWGEGSYIEPNLEFGFEMYEAVRAVFGRGDPASWPVNYGPADAGFGPYGYPPQPEVTAWTFDAPSPDWTALMAVDAFRCTNGALRFTTSGSDPAVQARLRRVRARDFGRAVLTMQVEGGRPAGERGQLFWSADAAAASERTSVTFALAADGGMHDYEIDLKSNPRWRGRIASLRLDPCNRPGLRVTIDAFALKP